MIEGGTAANVVAERCRVELEARSLDDARAGEVVSALVDACTEAASDSECDLETHVEELFRAYRLPRTHPAVETAARALGGCGIEPSFITTGGGSDANAFIAAGLTVLNVANGTERNHQPDESVTVAGAGDDARRDVRDRPGSFRGVSFERVASEEVYSGLIATVRVDTFRHDDGEEVKREYVAHPGAVVMLAHDGERLYLVRQPREAAGLEALLELPAGKLDEEGEEPEQTVRRELAEEIGKGARQVEHVKSFYASPGLHRRADAPLPVHRSLRRGGGGRRERAHRGRNHPARPPRRRDRRDPRRQDADRAPLAQGLPTAA